MDRTIEKSNKYTKSNETYINKNSLFNFPKIKFMIMLYNCCMHILLLHLVKDEWSCLKLKLLDM